MSTLNVTNTFAAGNVITAAGHNQNFSDIVTWANGNISDSNFGTMTGEVTWSVTTNELAVNITNTGTEGSLSIAQNGTLTTGKSAVKISSNAAQAAGNALLELVTSSSSMDLPALKITDVGGGGRGVIEVVSTTKPSLPFPKMTTTQRNAMDTPSEGMGIYNTTNKRYELYDGTNWVDFSGKTGTVQNWLSTTLKPDMLACDGSAVSRTTYAGLFAILSTTFGIGDGSTTFNLPDLRGRVTVGSGTGSGLTARTIADSAGGETLPAHTHGLTASSTSTDGAHTHYLFMDGSVSEGTAAVTNGNETLQCAGTVTGTGASIYDIRAQAGTPSAGVSGSNGSHSHTLSGSVDSTGTGSHGVMQPFLVVTKVVII